MKYALKDPVTVGEGGTPITELNFREKVCAGDMRGIPMRDPMDWGDVLKLAGRLCAQPDTVIDRLSFADLMEVAKIVGGFLGGGHATGSIT